MIDIADNRLEGIVPVIGKSALAAIIAGFAFGVTSMIMNLIWQNYYDNNELTQLMNIQWVANILLVIILTAAISIALSATWIKSIKASVVPGFISGFVLAFTAPFFLVSAALVQMSPIFVSRTPETYTMFDSFSENPIGYFIGFFAAGGYILVVYGLIAAVIMGIIGLTYWSYFVKLKTSLSGNIRNVSVKWITVVLAAMAIVLIVPPAIGITGLHTGLIQKSWNEYYGDYAGTVTVSRVSEDMINISYIGSSDLQLDSKMPIMISIDGKNATNMEAIKQSGLNASISPAEGLKNVKGSYVMLTGEGVLPVIHHNDYNNNTYNGTLVAILYIRYNGAIDVVYESYV